MDTGLKAKLAAVSGSIGAAAGAIVWLHSIGALPADFLFWSIVTLLLVVQNYGISWGVTEAIKRQHIPRPWTTPERRKRIYRLAMVWAALPSTSAAIGIYLTQTPPIWYAFITPWVIVFLAATSPGLWSLTFERLLPRLKRIRKADGSEHTVSADFPTDHAAGDRTTLPEDES